MPLTLSRPGSNNGGVDAKELFYKVFAGEILTKYQEESVTNGRFLERTIEHGN